MRIWGDFPNNYCTNMEITAFLFVTIRSGRLNSRIVLKVLMGWAIV